ncbi:uncharacterized protein JCM10292_007243 [Rhodotorula paludigena]|uniref:uncharacterized protein n=1 Tax=Rhodotorula paludigena TaxID=86838 RepID=UPI003171CAE4
MADVLLYGLAYVVTDVSQKIANLRSPIVPISVDSFANAPPPLPVHLARTDELQFLPPIVTEHSLALAHHSWATRHAAIWLKLCALNDARAKNLIGCWAGLTQGEVGRENIRQARQAVDEAAWVEERLKQALDWCDERKVRKMKLVKLVRYRKGRRSAITRPTHTDVPPTLLDLPFPIPLAPPSNRMAPFIPRPPPLERETQAEAEERNRPPTYTREADATNGESTLEGGFLSGEVDVQEYEAALMEDDDILRALQTHHPRMS